MSSTADVPEGCGPSSNVRPMPLEWVSPSGSRNAAAIAGTTGAGAGATHAPTAAAAISAPLRITAETIQLDAQLVTRIGDTCQPESAIRLIVEANVAPSPAEGNHWAASDDRFEHSEAACRMNQCIDRCQPFGHDVGEGLHAHPLLAVIHPT